MGYIKKEIRLRVWNKYGNRCAYCGIELEYKEMQVDHIEAHWHNATKEECKKWGVTKGEHSELNMNPSCVRCNRWKHTFSIEAFRNEIALQLERLKKYNPNYRMALDYGLINENEKPVEFFFEQVGKIINKKV